MTSLLGPGRPHGTAVGIPEQRLLLDGAPGSDDLDLPRELGVQGALDARERVHVLDFGLRSQPRRTAVADADVRVDAEAALFHVEVTHVNVLEQLLEEAKIRAGLGTRSNVRLAH